MYNKVFLQFTEQSEIISIKARTILPGGKIIDLPQSKILDVVEEGKKYKQFAFEGVEKGCEVEYIYTVKKPVSFFSTENFQSKYSPTQRAEFMLAVPSRLVFDVKGYHNFNVDRDTVINEKRV